MLTFRPGHGHAECRQASHQGATACSKSFPIRSATRCAAGARRARQDRLPCRRPARRNGVDHGDEPGVRRSRADPGALHRRWPRRLRRRCVARRSRQCRLAGAARRGCGCADAATAGARDRRRSRHRRQQRRDRREMRSRARTAKARDCTSAATRICRRAGCRPIRHPRPWRASLRIPGVRARAGGDVRRHARPRRRARGRSASTAWRAAA